MNPSAVRPAPSRGGDPPGSSAKICPRCRRANPADAAYCYFDGGNLVAHQDGAQRLPSDFLFPSGRRAKTLEDFANACQDEWATSRDFLKNGAIRQFFTSIGRHDLARVAQDSATETIPDVALNRFLESLPVSRVNVPKLDLQPRRFFLGRIPTDDSRELELVLSNPGKGTLQGTVSITEGADWLTLAGGGAVQVVAGREQRLKLKLDVKKLQASQNYAGQLRVVTSGGVVEVPIRFELVARPFAKAPFQGVRTPRELAEKMRAQPKQAGPLLESGDIERWFAGNNWPYPVSGPIAKGIAGVQQFFEAMGLSKPPKLSLSQREVRYSARYPDPVRFQVVLSSPSKKWVYADVRSDREWLKVLTPKVIGPQSANILLEADPTLMTKFPPEGANVSVSGNGGQKLGLKVALDVQGAPLPEIKNRWQPVFAFLVLFALLRALLVPVVDLNMPTSAATAAAKRVDVPFDPATTRLPWVSLLAGFDGPLPGIVPQLAGRAPEETARLARDFRRYFVAELLRAVVAWTWIPLAVLASLLMLRANRDSSPFWPTNLIPAILAGTVAGFVAAATLACLFLTVEILPRIVWSLTFEALGVDATAIWVVIAILGWAAAGVVVGFILAVAIPVRVIVYPPFQSVLAGVFALCGLRRLSRRFAAVEDR
jgi:hypothetical protein